MLDSKFNEVWVHDAFWYLLEVAVKDKALWNIGSHSWHSCKVVKEGKDLFLSLLISILFRFQVDWSCHDATLPVTKHWFWLLV